MIQEYMVLLHQEIIKSLLLIKVFLQVVIKTIIAHLGAWKQTKLLMIKLKDIIYENAILNIYDVPVFYFPKFFHQTPL